MNANIDGLQDRLWDAVARIRDASPRLPLRYGDPADADTDDIVAAVLPVLANELRAIADEIGGTDYGRVAAQVLHGRADDIATRIG